MRGMRMFILLPVFMLGLAGCTQQMQESWQKEQQAWANMNIIGNVGAVTGLDQVFKSERTLVKEQEQGLCWQQGSHQRVVTVDGINDSFAYATCHATPEPQEPPARLQGRPTAGKNFLYNR